MRWILISLIATAVIACPAMAANGPLENVTVDLSQLRPPFRGWGTSLAWWANGVGNWPDETVNQIVKAIADEHEGLGLTVFRYNIGGGDEPGHHHMRQWADVPGFKSAADAPYDWTADANQRKVLSKLVKAVNGHAIVEGFSNSAPWWMTNSGCVAGSKDGSGNLKLECEIPFANYLADVVQHLKQTDGIAFDSLEPFNEPDVNWWKAGKDQEGMGVPRDQQARVIKFLRAALDDRQMRSTRVSATDANSIDDCLVSLQSYNAPTMAALAQLNTHSYYGSKRAELALAASQHDKPVWISESGPLNVGGSEFEQIMKMAHRIVQDTNELQPEVWCMWQAVSGGPWGCIHDSARNKSFRIGKAFYMYAAFTVSVRRTADSLSRIVR